MGARGVSAEEVASRAADEAERYLSSGAPVGPHLADQLVLLVALAGSGEIHATELTAHARTQLDVCRCFLGAVADVEPQPGGFVLVSFR